MIKKTSKKSIKTKKTINKDKQVIKRVIHKLSTGNVSKCRVVLKQVTFLFIFIISFFIFLSGIYFYLTTPNVDDLKAVTRKSIITLKDEKHKFISIIGNQYEYPIDINKINPLLKKAVILTEDRRFYEHGALDYIGILRALYINLKSGSKVQGGSTITQQVAKNLFLTNEKSFSRKIREALLAYKLESVFTKDDILEIYLNRAYFGFGVYGINSAAKRYYDKSAYGLSLYEIATLVGMLKAPNGYNPVLNFEKSKKRARLVLSLMGYNPDLIRESLPINNTKRKSGYFIDFIESEIKGYLGEVSEDITVITTYDLQLQSLIENVVKNKKKPKDIEVAVVVMSDDGKIKAMVGGVDYKKSEFNRAYQAKKQIGSTAKPFVYLSAIERGLKIDDYIKDEPVKGFNVQNYDKSYRGDVKISDAFDKSLNTTALKVAKYAGFKNVKKTMTKFGLDVSCVDSEIIALGVCSSSLIELVSSYASISNGGHLVNPYTLLYIDSNYNNKRLYERKYSDLIKISDENSIFILDNMLKSAVKQGTGKKAFIKSKNIKGKTGTTQNGRDAYFIGYYDNIVVGVWVGYDDERHTNITGGGLPAEIFKEIMEVIN